MGVVFGSVPGCWLPPLSPGASVVGVVFGSFPGCWLPPLSAGGAAGVVGDEGSVASPVCWPLPPTDVTRVDVAIVSANESEVEPPGEGVTVAVSPDVVWPAAGGAGELPGSCRIFW